MKMPRIDAAFLHLARKMTGQILSRPFIVGFMMNSASALPARGTVGEKITEFRHFGLKCVLSGKLVGKFASIPEFDAHGACPES
jgi:hypothetical protein